VDILQELADYWHRTTPHYDGDDRHPHEVYRLGLISHAELWAIVTRVTA
jgi:hypothetical protein